MKLFQRSRVFVDAPVQGGLILRVLMYWLLAVAAIGLLVTMQIAVASKTAGWDMLINRALLAFGPALIASVIILPLVLIDALRFSHRLAGPMFRLKKEFKKVADGGNFKPLVFREGDHWYELASEFNRVAAELDSHRKKSALGVTPRVAETEKTEAEKTEAETETIDQELASSR